MTLLALDRERFNGGRGRIKYASKQLVANGYDASEVLSCKLEDESMEEVSADNHLKKGVDACIGLCIT